MKFFYFLTQKKFYLHLLIIIAITLISLWLVLRFLSTYTRHDEVLIVPDFIGENYYDVDERYSETFRFVLSDSVYKEGAEGGSIVQQDPLPGSKVKQGRRMYCVVVASNPEMTVMPNLRNLSLRQAIVLLQKNGLGVESLDYVDFFAQNAVIEQYKDSEIIEPGTQLSKGTLISLKVGNGNNNAKTVFPNMIGVYYKDVRKMLANASLNVGKESFATDDDMSHMRVYRTEPEFERNLMVPLGQKVRIWYRSETKFNFEEYIRELFVKDSIEQARLLIQKTATDTTDNSLNMFMGSEEYIESLLSDEEEDEF